MYLLKYVSTCISNISNIHVYTYISYISNIYETYMVMATAAAINPGILRANLCIQNYMDICVSAYICVYTFFIYFKYISNMYGNGKCCCYEFGYPACQFVYMDIYGYMYLRTCVYTYISYISNIYQICMMMACICVYTCIFHIFQIYTKYV